jgi:hypothetical protein
MHDAPAFTFPSPALCLHELRPAPDRGLCPPLFYAPLGYVGQSSPLSQNPPFEDGGRGTDG